MARARSVSLLVFIFALSTFSSLAQSAPNQDGLAQAGKVPEVTSADANDADSADVPPVGRGRISPEQYLTLRDQHLHTLRGLGDLAANPGMRPNAIRSMQMQEQFLRNFVFPLGATAGAAGFAVPAWTPLGPDPIPNGQTTGTQVPVSGRVTAIAIDPTNENVVYVGTAQGGLYRTLDAGAHWTALMDSAQSLAIGALTLDPTDPTTLFVGTGEGNFSGDSFFGVGLYIIRNANTTALLSGPFNSNGTSDVFTGRSITRILVNPANHDQILVSTASGFSGMSSDTFNTLPTRGVYLSTAALSSPTPTFSLQSIQTANVNRSVTDMIMDPANPAKVLVAVFGLGNANDGGIWVSTAGDPFAGTATWTQTLILGGTTGTIVKFAANHPTAGVTTFMATGSDTAACGPANTQTAGTLRSSLDGVTWTPIPGATGFCGGQCFYDEPVALDPQHANIIYIGGNADSTGTAPLACGSAAFAKSSDGVNFSRSGNSLHPDSHAIAIAPSNNQVIYMGNDGGIFRSADGGTTWASINTAGFQATQFESLAVHSTDPNFTLGGTQDNGTELMKPDGTWTRADFGDGGFALIDQSTSSTTSINLYHTYFNLSGASTGLIGVATATVIAGAVDGSWNFLGCPATPGSGITGNGITCADAVLFYAPMALGPGTPNTFYFGTDHLYRSVNGGQIMSVVSQSPLATGATGNVPVSAIAIAPQDDTVRLVGLANGSVFATTTGSSTLTQQPNSWGAHYVARAAIDPTASSTAYITLDGYGFPNHVWKTTNLNAAPPTWTAASTGLPDVPVNAFAIDPFNPSYLYAGTDIGVFNSIDGGTTWAPYGTGLPRVAVFDLNIQRTAHKIRIGTHGRGAWEIAASTFANTISNAVDNAGPTFGSQVTFTATVNKGTGVPVPTGTVTFSDGANVLGSGALNSSGVATFSTTTLAVGPHSVSAAYGGDTLYAPSNSAAVPVTVVTVGVAPTTTGLAASAASAVFGTSVTLTATVDKGTGTAVPKGNVTFSEGATVLGTGALNASAVATLTTSALAVGTHNITAAYSGDVNYAASTSTAVAVTVLAPPDYAVSTPTGTATVTAGQPATYTITVTPSGGFSSAVNFSCSGLPSLASCAFNPASVTPNGSAASTTLTISTTVRGAASPAGNLGAGLIGGGSFFALALVFGLTDKKRRLQVLCISLLALGILGTMVACGGGGGTPSPTPTPAPGTPAGTFNVTVTATSGSITHSSVITLVVR